MPGAAREGIPTMSNIHLLLLLFLAPPATVVALACWIAFISRHHRRRIPRKLERPGRYRVDGDGLVSRADILERGAHVCTRANGLPIFEEKLTAENQNPKDQ